MDVALIETNNGGDFVKKAKDLLTIEGFQNMPYLGLFGGNVQASTPSRRLKNEQAFDFWGNSLLKNDSSTQFNSNTERVLNQVELSSSSRIRIAEAIKEDLKFMQPFAKVLIGVNIISTDRALFGVRLLQPDNIQEKDFIFIWDATKKELDGEAIGNSLTPTIVISGFNYTLNFDIE
jgi:hypothetical protein